MECHSEFTLCCWLTAGFSKHLHRLNLCWVAGGQRGWLNRRVPSHPARWTDGMGVCFFLFATNSNPLCHHTVTNLASVAPIDGQIFVRQTAHEWHVFKLHLLCQQTGSPLLVRSCRKNPHLIVLATKVFLYKLFPCTAPNQGQTAKHLCSWHCPCYLVDSTVQVMRRK